jgi:hypothetical protein
MRVSVFPLIILGLFIGFTLWAMAGTEQSLLAVGVQLMSSPDPAQVVIDLYILATLACAWMYQDAKNRGKGLGYLIPFFILTAVFVSAGPLLYLVLRGEGKADAANSKT